MMDAVSRLAPGTPLREALDNILRAQTGALIVIGDQDSILDLTDGGFPVSASATPEHLYELSKLDGALILDRDARSVTMANVQLIPDPALPSDEAGIKHRAAQRMAAQTGELVIAISRRRNLITLYRGSQRHVLRDPGTVLARVDQAVSTLDRYRSILDTSLASLTMLEFDNMVTVRDVAVTLARAEMVLCMASEVELDIRELGTEGRMARMQVDELVGGVKEAVLLLISDYRARTDVDLSDIQKVVARSCPYGKPPDLLSIARALGLNGSPDLMDRAVVPRGRRVLSQIPRLPSAVVDNVVRTLDVLPAILAADDELLDSIEGIGSARARAVREGLARIREQARLHRVR